MNKHSVVARLSLLLVSLFSSIDIGRASWISVKDKEEASIAISSDPGRAVCYIGDTYYTSLDVALDVAHENGKDDTIYVIPGLKKSNGDILPVEITGTRYLDKGDTLNLPYEGETYYRDSSFDQDQGDGTEYYFADENVDAYRKTQVILEGTFNVKGIINIGADLDKNLQPVTGQTTGAYCEITMENGSNLICDGVYGKINCYGYIKRAAKKSTALLTIQNSGTLLTPFVMYDFKGGSFTKATVELDESDKFCPFQVFDFCNVQVKVKIEAGSGWKTRACLYGNVNGSFNYIPVNNLFFIGPEPSSSDESSQPALILKDGYIEVEYVPDDIEKMTLIKTSKYVINQSKTYINIHGEVDIGGITVGFLLYTIKTSQFFFPISYKFDFTINKGSVLNVGKKVKFMNGSSMRVNAGAKVNLKSSLIFYDGETEGKKYEDTSTGLACLYPSGLGSATLVNNGVINVESGGAIGGYVNVETEGAELNYGATAYTVSSPEVSSWDSGTGTLTVASHSETATGPLTSGADYEEAGDLEYYNYKSSVSSSNNKCAWYHEKKEEEAEKIEFEDFVFSQDGSCGSVKVEIKESLQSKYSASSLQWRLDATNISGIKSVADGGQKASTEYADNCITIDGSGYSVTIKNTSTKAQTIRVVVVTKDKKATGEDVFTVQGRLWEVKDVSFDVRTEEDSTQELTDTSSMAVQGEPEASSFLGVTATTYKYYSKTSYDVATKYRLKVNVTNPTNFDSSNVTYWWQMTSAPNVSAKNITYVDPVTNNNAVLDTTGKAISTKSPIITACLTGKNKGGYILLNFCIAYNDGLESDDKYYPEKSLIKDNKIKNNADSIKVKFFANKS